MDHNENIHPDESTLELFVLGARETDAQRDWIESHLLSCEGCRALRDEIACFYADMEALRNAEEAAGPDALSVRDRIVPYRGDMDPMPQARKPMPVRIVASLVRHPVRTSVGFLAILAMVLGVNYRSKIWKDPNPASGRGLRDSLIVFNKDGEELWSTWIGYRADLNFIPDWFTVDNWIVVRDLTGDGMNEVVCCLALRPDSSRRNYMGSWSRDGSIRWEYEFRREVAVGGVSLVDDFRFLGMVVDRFEPDAGDEIIGVVEHPLSPLRAIVTLDALTGREEGVFWHYGNVIQFKAAEAGRDGLKDFYFSGYNETYRSVFLGVLDPRFVAGSGPSEGSNPIDGAGPGTEKFYVLFPHPDIEESVQGNSQEPGRMLFPSPDTLKVSIYTKINDRTYLPLEYHFDARMRCVAVTTSPEFINYHRELEGKGLVNRKFDQSYLENMRTQVRYWDGERFVYEPVINRYYPGVLEAGGIQ